MEKIAKITVKYRNGMLPNGLNDILQNADENDLRILSVMLMLADKESGTLLLSDLYDTIGLQQAEIDASLKYWRGAGIVTRTSSSKASKTEKNESTYTVDNNYNNNKDIKKMSEESFDQLKKIETAHKNGVIERSGTLQNYSTSELAELMEKRKMFAQLVDEAQRVMGKMFRTYDTGILMGIVDQLGFDEEAVLAILAYTVKKGKKTLRYAEQIAIAFYDDGVTSTSAVMDRIHRMELSEETIGKIRSLFGIGERSLTTLEKKLFSAWTEKFGYDIDVIRMAYDITVDNIQKPVPKYTNSILEKWNSEGLRTSDDVRQYIESDTEQKNKDSTTMKSYDVEDFFEAALRRSYEDMK